MLYTCYHIFLLYNYTDCTCSSLANVLLQTPAVTPSTEQPSDEDHQSLPGMMSYMTQQHIQILMSCLDLSYDGAIQFDSRPGLKFLVQKVAGLDQAANLYRQAGAAWTLKVVTLFDLCLHEVKKSGATLDRVKRIIEDEDAKLKLELDKSKDDSVISVSEDGIMKKPSVSGNPDYDYNDMTMFLKRLRQSFDNLCDTYIDVVLDKNGTHSAVDRISDQPIFFLIAQTDDFPDIKWKDLPEKNEIKIDELKVDISTVQTNNTSQTSNEDNVNDEKEDVVEKPNQNDSPIKKSNGGGNETEEKKPFLFSDLAQQYVDSSSEEDVEERRNTNQAEDSVYNVAGGSDVEGLMDEYKKRKQQCVMPPQPGQYEKRKNPFLPQPKSSTDPPLAPMEPLPPEIEQQRKTSIYKVSYFIIYHLKLLESHRFCFLPSVRGLRYR